MRILMLALVSTRSEHLAHKFDAQFRALRFHNPDTHCVVFSGSPAGDADVFALRWIGGLSRAQRFAAASGIAERLRPDIIYFRYPFFDELCHRFVERHPNTVFEHHSIAQTELEGEERRTEGRWGPRILSRCAGIVAVTNEIREHEQARSGRSLPGITISNGITPDQTPLLHRPGLGDELHIALAASFSPRHGIDRLITGIAVCRRASAVHLHLAGRQSTEEGSSEQLFLKAAEQAGIAEQLHFHGYLSHSQLPGLLEQCHIAAGTLSVSRRGLAEVAALKHRTYTWLGIPFFYGGKDPDFSPELPFALRLPDDEGPVDMDRVWEFARKVAALPAIGEEMRTYAREALTWEAKSEKLLGFLRSLSVAPRAGEARRFLFSCVVLCKGDFSAVRKCVESLLDRKDGRMEIILAYDGNDAAMAGQLHRLASQYEEQVSLSLAAAEHSRASVLRAAGINASSGEWIWCIDSAFAASPGSLEAVLQAIGEHPECDLISGETSCGTIGSRTGLPTGLVRFWQRRLRVRPVIVKRERADAVYEKERNAAWRRGDRRFIRKCRRDGLVPVHLEQPLLRFHSCSLCERIRYAARILCNPDI